ncbi:MAG: DUF4082 domain-containing protein [Kineosporiaceae bacterium]
MGPGRPSAVVLRRFAALRRAALLLVAALAAGTVVSVAAPASAVTVFGQACPAGQSAVVCENARPGTPASTWDINGIGDASIQGFATSMSVNLGQRVDFKIKTDATAYRAEIYRLGWYGGSGARLVGTVNPSVPLPQNQPACLTEAATRLVDCGNWGVSASWQVPSDALSGVYLARLVRTDTGGDSHVVFVVRDDASTSDLVFQTSDTTWQAYNRYGGSNFYPGGEGRALKLSYNRPFTTRADVPDGRDWLFANEYPMIRFLERNGYDVSYLSGVDTHRDGSLLRRHKTFLSVGHDEYWSGQQRANVEAARDAGVHLAFFSGNEVYWRTRYEPSIDGSATALRTLVCYKETWDNAKTDPSSEWTGTWRDPRFATPDQGAGRPENALTGTAYMSNSISFPLQVAAEDGRMRFWRNTSVATQSPGGVASIGSAIIGYESNEDLDNGFRPAGLFRVSTTVADTPELLQDFGTVVAPGRTTHSATMYRAPSGALVFSAGTIQWSWGLDNYHDGPGWASAGRATDADVRIQQATVNLFADMGAQPATLMTGLVPATATTDTQPPTVTVTAPAAPATLQNGTRVTVTGTAADSAGAVAGVEVSLDAGRTWHPATGRQNWSYQGVLGGLGADGIKVRAVDDSGNLSAPTTRAITVRCPCSLLGDAQPARPPADDRSALELGVRFTPTTDGLVQGIRFYKGTGNTGTHVGTLWSTTGQVLARGTFTAETASGWQEMRFASPVAVSAGTRYVASYQAPNGGYHGDPATLYQGLARTPLAVPTPTASEPASVYGAPNTFPTQTFQATNYYVDVVFTDSASIPLLVTSRAPVPDTSSVPVDSAVVVGFSRAVTASSVQVRLTPEGGTATSLPVTLTTGADGRPVATARPAAGLQPGTRYTVAVDARDTSGAALTPTDTWSFVTSYGSLTGTCPCGLFADVVPPGGVPAQNDASPVELGVRFTPTEDGTVDGVRFLKVPGVSGSHVGTLWSAGGQRLAEATFAGETTTGWQLVRFATPVPVTAGTEYVVSYRSPGGVYPATPNGFGGSGIDRPPLRAAADSGMYTYAAGAFPGNRSTANYWVDALFRPRPPDTTPPAVTARTPDAGATGIATDVVVDATFASPVQPGTARVSVVDVATGAAVAGSLQESAADRRVSLTPSAPLAVATTYEVTVSGARSLGGTLMTPLTWRFTTLAGDRCPCTIFTGSEQPAVASTSDTAAVELGTRFTPLVDGRVTGIRFFKGTRNTGTHVGSLWSAGGTRLAQVTFTNETASGWQTAVLSSPVTVQAGTTYVVSYLAPNGGYAQTTGYFTADRTRGPLLAPGASNGVFRYGAGGGFPSSSWQGSNYFVDVVFDVSTAAPTVTARTPAAGATGVGTGTAVTATFSAPLSPSTVAMTVTAGGTPVRGTTVYPAGSLAATFQPADPLPAGATLGVTVAGVSYAGVALGGTRTWSFTTGTSPDGCPCSVFPSTATPAVAAAADTASVELGLRFTPSATGFVTGVRFFKGSGNTGTHVGSIWTAGGTRLAQVTFTGETASGWQTAYFSSPVAVTAGTTYVVSYTAPNGRYSVTYDAFTSPRTAGPLTVPSGANGVYRYGGGFPSDSYRSSNYWVDVVYRTA